MKFKTLKIMFGNKDFLIDFTFYIFLFFGFICVAFVSQAFELELKVAVALWVILFVPLLWLKLNKDIKKAKNKKVDFYKGETNE